MNAKYGLKPFLILAACSGNDDSSSRSAQRRPQAVADT
jgi:hypothetical protein